jgi:hypothetical protein
MGFLEANTPSQKFENQLSKIFGASQRDIINC